MRFYVWFATGQYDPQQLSEFGSEEEVIEFLNSHASNHEFTFKVVHGSEVMFRAVSTATSYVRAST